MKGLIRYLRRHHIGLPALVVALGGTAYATETIGSRDIVDGSLRSKDLADGTVRGRDLKPDSLKGTQIDEGTIDNVLGHLI